MLRGHWYALKAADWLPLREDVAEQLEIAYHKKVFAFGPSHTLVELVILSMKMLQTNDLLLGYLCRFGVVEVFNHQDCMLPVLTSQGLLWFVRHLLVYHYFIF